MLKAVLFDLDGTLVDTERLYLQANATAAAQLGQPLPAAAFQRLVGAGDLRQNAWLQAQFGETLEAFIRLSDELVMQQLAKVPVLPGASAPRGHPTAEPPAPAWGSVGIGDGEPQRLCESHRHAAALAPV